MPRKKNNAAGTIPVEAVKHKDKRANIPTRELRGFVEADENQPKTILYPRDPSLDPQLVWKGKDCHVQSDLHLLLRSVRQWGGVVRLGHYGFNGSGDRRIRPASLYSGRGYLGHDDLRCAGNRVLARECAFL